jgi:2-dehydropantoate 2-reductase
MRVAVVGAGQMGAIYGAAAHENGNEVCFVDANQSLVDRISASGLRIDRRDGRSEHYTLPIVRDAATAGGPADLVLFMVKGWATAAAADGVRPLVGPDTALLTLQNGLGNEEFIRAAFPDHDILIGVSVHTVITLDLGHYSHTGVRDTYLGPTRGDGLELALRAATTFDRSGFTVHVLPESDIRREQWAKFVLNCGSLPTMALTRLPTDAVDDLPVVFEHMDNLTRETCQIAQAEGIELDADERVAFQHEAVPYGRRPRVDARRCPGPAADRDRQHQRRRRDPCRQAWSRRASEPGDGGAGQGPRGLVRDRRAMRRLIRRRRCAARDGGSSPATTPGDPQPRGGTA